MKALNLIEKYVPRHFRLGLCCELPNIEAYQDFLESIPVVDEKGSVVFTKSVLKSVPVHEAFVKYNVSQFRLSALVKSGVPLKVVNINSSNVATFEQLKTICESLDNADAYVQRVMDERRERESWFKSFNEESLEQTK